MGEYFIYDDEVLQELMHDRHGTARSETELTISTLIGSNTKVTGNTWTVRGDITPEEIGIEEEGGMTNWKISRKVD